MDFFQQEMENNVTKARVNFISTNYAAEKAINKYRSVKDLPSEGKAYKESINNMFLQNDDLNNKSLFKFYRNISL